MKKIVTCAVSIAGSALILASIAVTPALAQNVNATTTAGSRMQANATARLAKIISRSDAAIGARIDALNKLNARVQAMKNVSDSEKASVSNEISTNISGLTSLKAKIDADTDATTALNDEKMITGNYRIYALIMPQWSILAAADRVDTIASMMTTVGTKLQTRISADQSAGKDIASLQASLTDYNAKIADAETQATNAKNGISSLTPDNGDKTLLASNTAALKAARADIKTASADLVAARKDAKDIVQGLKALNPKASVNASSSATISQ